MHPRSLRLVAFAAAGLCVSSCSQTGTGEGMFGHEGMSGPGGGPARAGSMSSAESFATGAPTGSIIAATTFIVAKHRATVRQRSVAQERGRTAVKRLRARDRSPNVPASSPRRRAASKPAVKVPRYIAVDTVKDERTSPKAAKSVMIFDTESQQVVGNDVYDIATTPPVGSTARFETYSAEYVGPGI